MLIEHVANATIVNAAIVQGFLQNVSLRYLLTCWSQRSRHQFLIKFVWHTVCGNIAEDVADILPSLLHLLLISSPYILICGLV